MSHQESAPLQLEVEDCSESSVSRRQRLRHARRKGPTAKTETLADKQP